MGGSECSAREGPIIFGDKESEQLQLGLVLPSDGSICYYQTSLAGHGSWDAQAAEAEASVEESPSTDELAGRLLGQDPCTVVAFYCSTEEFEQKLKAYFRKCRIETALASTGQRPHAMLEQE